uniref:Uncharacterized protein n=1 Tax=Opuntia streptacantha TaxID=393608 RepID=A0A7C9DH85_OPUST
MRKEDATRPVNLNCLQKRLITSSIRNCFFFLPFSFLFFGFFMVIHMTKVTVHQGVNTSHQQGISLQVGFLLLLQSPALPIHSWTSRWLWMDQMHDWLQTWLDSRMNFCYEDSS